MSKLYATLDADVSKTTSTKRGHKWVKVRACSWHGAIVVRIDTDEHGTEHYTVCRESWQGNGTDKIGLLARGVM